MLFFNLGNTVKPIPASIGVSTFVCVGGGGKKKRELIHAKYIIMQSLSLKNNNLPRVLYDSVKRICTIKEKRTEARKKKKMPD